MTHAAHVGAQDSHPQTLRTPFTSPSKTSYTRPISEATEIFESDAEDDESLFEENSPKPSFNSFDSRRRSETTISSFEEALTPRSEVQFDRNGPFQLQGKPVEGPKGVCLFTTGLVRPSVERWSTQDVLNWMLETGLPHEVVDKFEKHDINGSILMELKFENLKELEIESFGKPLYLHLSRTSLVLQPM
ncbi:hypothetical protein KCU74_g11, partial [Aureobasidium melanogenum]